MGTIYTRNGSIITAHSELTAVGDALSAGETLVDAAGLPLQSVEFMGGLLLGPYALPMNVILYDTWYPTQKEILQPYWDSGQFPRPPAAIVNLATVDPAESTGLSTVTIALLAFAAYKLIRR